MIDSGAFLKEIAAYCKLDEETTRSRLNDLGLKIKNTNKINKRIVNDYFSVIDTPEKAYWLGFLFTDGNVAYCGNRARIRLQLQEQDKEILEKFKNDFGLDCKIIYDSRPNSVCCSVEFVSKQIFNDLATYGIVPRKTYETKHIPYNKIPKEYWNSFALGLFDGDGGLSCSENFSTDVTLGYTAYHKTEVLDFQKLVNTLINNNTPNKCFFTSAWHVQWRGRLQVIKILDILYKDCSRYLARKYNIYCALKSSLK